MRIRVTIMFALGVSAKAAAQAPAPTAGPLAPAPAPAPAPTAASATDPVPTYRPPAFLSAPPTLPGGESLAPQRISLRDAIVAASRNNLDIVLEREEARAAGYRVDSAREAYTPTLELSAQHDSQRFSASTSAEAGDRLGVGVRQRLPTGANVSARWDNSRSRSAVEEPIDPVRSAVSLSITQPLLRGFSLDLAVPRAEVLRARFADSRQQLVLERALSEVVLRTELTYWDLVATLYAYDVTAKAVSAAESHFDLIGRQIEAGVLAPNERVTAEANLAERKLSLVAAAQQVEAATDALRMMMGIPPGQWTKPLLPIDVPTFAAEAGDVDSALALARRQRPDRAQLEIDLKDRALSERLARNDRLPQLDLGLSGQLEGRDDTGRGAISGLTEGEGRGWSILLSMSWAPLVSTSSARLALERSASIQARVRLERFDRDLLREVRSAHRQKQTAAVELAAAARFRELAEESLLIEEKRFLAGESSNLEVNQRQQQATTARLQELRALLDHNRAGAQLHHTTGQLLASRGIRL